MSVFINVLLKELKTIFRDRRAFLSLFMPLLIIPLLYYCMGLQIEQTDISLDNKILISSNATSNNELMDIANDVFRELNIEYLTFEDPLDALKNEEIYLIVDFENSSLPISVTIKYNSNSNLSNSAFGLISSALSKSNDFLTVNALSEAGIDSSVLTNYIINTTDISVNGLLVLMGPTLMSMLLISATSSFAVDMFAGERERGGLERLFTTQASRTYILLGKFAAVLTVGFISSLISLSSYLIAIKISPGLSNMYGGNSTLSIDIHLILTVLITMFCYALFVSALLLFVSVLSRTVREAQSIISIITILPGIIGIIAMFMPVGTQSSFSMLIPIYSAIISFKSILGCMSASHQIAIACISMVIYGFVFLVLGRIALNSEKRIM